MIITVPITGEIINYDSKHPEVASGNPDNPVRPLDFNKLLPEGLGDFAWRALKFDFANGFTTIEVTFSKKTVVMERDTDGTPLAWKTESSAEFYKRQADTEKVLQDLFDKKTTAELHSITKEPKLKKPEVVG